MYQAACYVRSLSPYQQRKQLFEDRERQESADAFELRTCRQTAHYTAEGLVMIPPTQFTKALQNAAIHSKEPIPGKRGATFIPYFRSGVTCTVAPVLPYTIEDVPVVPVSVPSDGKPGGGKRVVRFFPTIEKWDGLTEWLIYDDLINPDVFERHLRIAGMFVGIGVWRIQKGGLYGRFEVESVKIMKL